jgi:hypothetical protein
MLISPALGSLMKNSVLSIPKFDVVTLKYNGRVSSEL